MINAEYYDIVIIGGGASGLMLAAVLSLAEAGGRSASLESADPGSAGVKRAARGLIIEKKPSPGTKLLMSGGGRCNITHGGSIKDFIEAYGSAGRKLRRCLYRHSNAELAKWLISHSLPLADSSGMPVTADNINDAGRIFPASMKAPDVLDLLVSQAEANGWELRTGTAVRGIRPYMPGVSGDPAEEAGASLPGGADAGSGGCWILDTDAGSVTAAAIAAATGGVTFPETGSDGCMLDILEGLGAEIVRPRPALAPIYVKDYPYGELAGITIENAEVSIRKDEGKPVRMTGDILFTHRGLSGPAVLDISRYAELGSRICINYNRPAGQLPKRLLRCLEDRARGSSGDIKTRLLDTLLTSDEFVIRAVEENGMVTAGGVSLDQIDTGTMQVRLPGRDGGRLYVIGEAIDADGISGGYNLQMCWSTACTAADALR